MLHEPRSSELTVSMRNHIRLALLTLFQIAWLFGAARAGEENLVGQEVTISLQDRQIQAAGIETAADRKGIRRWGTRRTRCGGRAAARSCAWLRPQRQGWWKCFWSQPDEQVKEGDPIARLKSSELVEAQRAFLHADADANLAFEKLRRDEQLFKERIIAERRLLVTRAEEIQARSILQERSELLSLVGMTNGEIATLRKDRRFVSALLVRAPMAGTVIARHGAAGERVQASAPLVTIARLDPIWVNLQIPIGRTASIEPNIRVTLPSLGLEGHLIRVGRTVDTATQSVTAVAEVHLGKNMVRPGQAVQAILGIRSDAGPHWRVPADAVVHHHDKSWVFVRTSNGFRAVPVTLLSETPQVASIRASLSATDRVATRGILTLLAELAAMDK